MKIKGKVLFINPTKDASKTEGKNFFLTTFALDTTTEVNGTVYESFVGFQATGAKANIMDNCNIGDLVEVDFAVNGTVKKKDFEATSKNPYSKECYTNLSAYAVTVIEADANTTNAANANATATGATAATETEDKPPF